MDNLSITDSKILKTSDITLPKGQYLKLQPQTVIKYIQFYNYLLRSNSCLLSHWNELSIIGIMYMHNVNNNIKWIDEINMSLCVCYVFIRNKCFCWMINYIHYYLYVSLLWTNQDI